MGLVTFYGLDDDAQEMMMAGTAANEAIISNAETWNLGSEAKKHFRCYYHETG